MTDRENELLNRFLDGELSDVGREEFEHSMRENSDLVAMRDDFEVIGAMLREHISCESEVVDFRGFAAGVDSLIGLEEPAPTAAYESTPQSKVQTPSAPESNLVVRAQSWWRKNWTPVMLGAAAAAAVLFFVMRPANSVDPGEQSSTQVASGAGTNGVVVDSISNEGKKTVLVSMPAQHDESTVIWLLDGEDENQDPAEGEDPI
jgi:negative regulator of sigma E activity